MCFLLKQKEVFRQSERERKRERVSVIYKYTVVIVYMIKYMVTAVKRVI